MKDWASVEAVNGCTTKRQVVWLSRYVNSACRFLRSSRTTPAFQVTFRGVVPGPAGKTGETSGFRLPVYTFGYWTGDPTGRLELSNCAIVRLGLADQFAASKGSTPWNIPAPARKMVRASFPGEYAKPIRGAKAADQPLVSVLNRAPISRLKRELMSQ